MSYSPRSFSLGVDLIEFRKAKVFYTNHKDNLKSFFTRPEISAIRRSKKPHEKIAVILAAKEAAYKAADTRDAGVLNFRDVSVNQHKNKRKGLLAKFGSRIFRLSVFKEKEYVVVGCRG